MEKFFARILLAFAFALPAQALDYKLLGNVVDQGQQWGSSGNTNWNEVGGTAWRVSFTPTVSGKMKLQAMLHIRSGDGNGHSRLYNKARIVRVAPVYSEQLALNSECMFEGTDGYGDQIRFMDCSRTIFAVDTAPSVGAANVYAVQVIGGDGIWVEVSYGSPFMLEFVPD